MNSSASRWLPLTGILTVLIITGGILLGEPPDASNPPQEIVDWYVDNKDTLQYGTIAFVVALILFVTFASYLRSVLDRGEGSTGISSLIAFGGAVVFAVGGAIDATIQFAITEAVDHLEPTQIQTLQALWDNDWVPLQLGITMFILASGLSIVRHKSLPVWLGWIAVIVGVAGLTPVGFVAFLATGAWIIVVGVMLLISERRASTPVVE
jgi:hypothetical protein